ncbi:MAG: hypothetical protein LC642_07060 [Verrucomicrobiaceae bacterium]|nr:hypothetical protein [Verrucomicrobiaceae bacterium]
MKRLYFSSLAAAIVAAISLQAQSPTPIMVQAAQPVAAAPGTPQPTGQSTSPDEALKILQQVKAANDAVLAKQAATLQQLEELEKNADQLKIYSKRG